MEEGEQLARLAVSIMAEAEQQQLIRRLQKAQRLNAELTAELATAKKKLVHTRHERNIILDRVYEREVATLEFTSGSSDEEEAPIPLPKRGGKREFEDHHHHHDMDGTGKKKRVVKTAEAAAMTPRKVQPVPIDDTGNPILPITIGLITLHRMGTVVFDRPSFHNKRYLWPVGYHTSRPYLSAIDPEAQTVYHSQILDGGPGPLFDVYSDDNPDQHYQSQTPTGAWTAIVKQVNAIRGRDYANSASGPDFFGLSNPTISMLLEKLPEADKCKQYQRKVYEVSDSTITSVKPIISTSKSVKVNEDDEVETEANADTEANVNVDENDLELDD